MSMVVRLHVISLVLLASLTWGGCQSVPGKKPAGSASGVFARKMIGMTVNPLGDHVKKHYGMSDVPVVSVMGETAFEIYEDPKNKAAARLVVAWGADDEGVPAVEDIRFSEKPLPPIDDEDAVIEFCEGLFKKNGKGGVQ